MEILEIVFHVMNGMLGLFGFAMFVSGIVFFTNGESLDDPYFTSSVVSVSVIGLAVVVMSVVGALGVIRWMRSLQLTYSVILGMLAIMVLVQSITFIISFKPDSTTGARTMTRMMKAYPSDKTKVDELQKKYKCCGTTAYDYRDVGLPPSCCDAPPCTECNMYTRLCDLVREAKIAHGRPSSYWSTVNIANFPISAYYIGMAVFMEVVHRTKAPPREEE
ncbi:Tetraspanin family [Nesidiocoris tenuis]|uniref:Tetraspanin family n=1 Tax=Nesidiocoris tenuis TaxID=355587 RepID=A0ABN7AI68_9HEMI|nr:Tetraspanin family [Nesidiocoris tenuis]